MSCVAWKTSCRYVNIACFASALAWETFLTNLIQWKTLWTHRTGTWLIALCASHRALSDIDPIGIDEKGLIETNSNTFLGWLLPKIFLEAFFALSSVFTFLTVSYTWLACSCWHEESSLALDTTINIAPLTVCLWTNDTLGIWVERSRWTWTGKAIKKCTIETLILYTCFSIRWNVETD